VPNLVVSTPRDAAELGRLTATAVKHPGPFAIRYPRGAAGELVVDIRPLPSLTWEMAKEGGKDVLLVAAGGGDAALQAADCAIGVMEANGLMEADPSTRPVPWAADVLTGPDLTQVLFCLQSVATARRVSRDAVWIALAGSATAAAWVLAGPAMTSGARASLPMNLAAFAAQCHGVVSAEVLARRPPPSRPAAPRQPWHEMAASEVLDAFGSGPGGLSQKEAARRQVVRAPAESSLSKVRRAVLSELKNPLTGQSTEHAKAQYRNDRDPANVTLSRRALVHFAVDPDRVAMTTRLSGGATRFLPFNLGHDGGAGNPPNPDGHRTSYLWERVWARDAWMDLLGRFVHVERPETGSAAARRAAERVIFPRLHQWDAVLALEAHARANGAGHRYLVQHSAGSGKSNTIAWTAHRLSSLHDEADTKVFDKVVVITDRVVLDRQLHKVALDDTIQQVVPGLDRRESRKAPALGHCICFRQPKCREVRTTYIANFAETHQVI